MTEPSNFDLISSTRNYIENEQNIFSVKGEKSHFSNETPLKNRLKFAKSKTLQTGTLNLRNEFEKKINNSGLDKVHNFYPSSLNREVTSSPVSKADSHVSTLRDTFEIFDVDHNQAEDEEYLKYYYDLKSKLEDIDNNKSPISNKRRKF